MEVTELEFHSVRAPTDERLKERFLVGLLSKKEPLAVIYSHCPAAAACSALAKCRRLVPCVVAQSKRKTGSHAHNSFSVNAFKGFELKTRFI